MSEIAKSVKIIEWKDRYGGIPCPDLKTACRGQCEGLGVVPIKYDDAREPWHSMWLVAEDVELSMDGWHFVTCPDCNGTGMRADPEKLENLFGRVVPEKLEKLRTPKKPGRRTMKVQMVLASLLVMYGWVMI